MARMASLDCMRPPPDCPAVLAQVDDGHAIAAAIPVLLYNGKRGALSLKYFFYISYPAHMLLLYAIHYVLANHLLPF